MASLFCMNIKLNRNNFNYDNKGFGISKRLSGLQAIQNSGWKQNYLQGIVYKNLQQKFEIYQRLSIIIQISKVKMDQYRERTKDYQYRRDHSSSRHKEKKKKHKHKDRDRETQRDYRYRKSRSTSHHRKRESPERSRHKHRQRRYDKHDDENGRDRHRDREHYKEKGYRDKSRERRDYKDRRDRKGDTKEKDPYFEERRQIDQIRKYDRNKADEMENGLEKRIILDQKQRQYDQMKEKFREAQKEMEEAKRQDHTIIVYCLPLKAKEKHIWTFFVKANCGKIRDIRIIKDARSGKSKGVAYVEFYTSESVEKALTMSQRPFELRGRQFISLKVQHSQAQKNRAAAAAKQMKLTKPVDPLEQAQQTQRREMKVYVGGLTDKLSEIQESQLKQLFEPFGPIDYVDIHRDPMTGKCKGFAFIQYSSTNDAKTAVRQMNNLSIGGQRITVQTVSTVSKGDVTAGEDILYSQGSKSALVSKLSRDAPSHSNLMRPPISTMSTPYLLLTNLFKMEGTTPKFFEDLKKQVMAQCSTYGIVEKCFVQKNNQGNVWVKFSDTQSAIKAQENLNGKYFDNAKLFCYFVTENTYQARVGI